MQHRRGRRGSAIPAARAAVFGLVFLLVAQAPAFGSAAESEPPAVSQPAGDPSGARGQPVLFQRPLRDEWPAEIEAWVDAYGHSHGVHVTAVDGAAWVLVAWGAKPTGGYEVAVQAVERLPGGDIRVKVALSAPPPDAVVIQVITYPFDLVVIPAASDAALHLEFVGARWEGALDDRPPLQPAAPLTDVQGHWAETDIHRAVARGYVTGYPDAAFRPDRPVTRAEFTQMLAGAFAFSAGPPVTSPFSDTQGHWAEGVIAAADHRGIAPGEAGGTFAPDRKMTRVEAVAMLLGALGRAAGAAASGDEAAFADVGDLPAELRGDVNLAVELGLVGGYPDGTFGPHRTLTRAEAVVLIERALALP